MSREIWLAPSVWLESSLCDCVRWISSVFRWLLAWRIKTWSALQPRTAPDWATTHDPGACTGPARLSLCGMLGKKPHWLVPKPSVSGFTWTSRPAYWLSIESRTIRPRRYVAFTRISTLLSSPVSASGLESAPPSLSVSSTEEKRSTEAYAFIAFCICFSSQLDCQNKNTILMHHKVLWCMCLSNFHLNNSRYMWTLSTIIYNLHVYG